MCQKYSWFIHVFHQPYNSNPWNLARTSLAHKHKLRHTAEQHEIAYDCHTFNRDRQWFDRFQLKIASVSSHTSLSAKTTLKYTPQSPSMWENEFFSLICHAWVLGLCSLFSDVLARAAFDLALSFWGPWMPILWLPISSLLDFVCNVLFLLVFFPGRIFVMCFAAVDCSLSQETSAMCHEDPQSPQAGSLMQQNCGKCSASNRKPGWDLLVTLASKCKECYSQNTSKCWEPFALRIMACWNCQNHLPGTGARHFSQVCHSGSPPFACTAYHRCILLPVEVLVAEGSL